MFQVQAPVVIVPSAEARAALGVQLRPAALAAWREIARRGENRAVSFVDAHRMVALFFGAMGINEPARVKVRTG